ncbi:MAG: FGGY-family carbohydrate kinase [Desulfosalsimonas sp.]|uniref:FGGY-family carbohydrate kinase n=1 Tax=Desulfosalsimonas sp. TaxID=3073848 RepID=UPI003970F852
MTTKDLLLTIDNGTQSLKAMAFDLSGRMQAIVKIPFTPYFSEKPGWAEQDPEMYWELLGRACQGLWSERKIERKRLAGVSVTTQRGTVINVDKNGRPLRPAILWLDQRKAINPPPVGGLWGLLFKVTGLSRTVAYFQQEAEANWLQTHQPEIWKKTHKYLLLSGYLTYRLTGEFSDSVGCQVAYLPFDYKRLAWAGNSDWKWRALPVDPDMLPRLIHPGGRLGLVSATAARHTGIPEGLPVIAAAADKACEVIGSGSMDAQTGCISYGTTATINVTHNRYVEPISLIPPYPSAIPGHHSLEVQIFRGYWMVSWFKNEFGHKEKQKAQNLGVDAEALFDRLIDDIAPGCMGLMLQPYWTPGIKMPGPEAKGSIIGFGDIHSRGHVYRAILEGLAYALREGKERIEKRTKTPIRQLRISGGGSQSRNAMQVTADVFNLPASRPHIYETSGLGAAINTAVGLNLHPDYPAAIAAMTRIGDTFEPIAENQRLYDTLYRRIYQKMYARLKPLYEEIREITGYPQ